jgi:Family of unknown function (DUF6006)
MKLIDRVYLGIAAFSLLLVNSPSQAVAGLTTAPGWLFESGNCRIDGRPAKMQWELVERNLGSCKGDICSNIPVAVPEGKFSDNGGPWIPLQLTKSSPTAISIRYLGKEQDNWDLSYNDSTGIASGNTNLRGKSSPLQCSKGTISSFNFENRSEGWWFAGNAGIDDGKNLEHNGRSNGWVRNSSGWNAVNNKADVKPNSQCTAAAWLRTSDTLTDGYMSVRSFKAGGGAGDVINEVKLVGTGSPNPQNRNYNRYTFNFNSGSNNTVLFYVGLHGNGKDSWIQADDVDISCR